MLQTMLWSRAMPRQLLFLSAPIVASLQTICCPNREVTLDLVLPLMVLLILVCVLLWLMLILVLLLLILVMLIFILIVLLRELVTRDLYVKVMACPFVLHG